MFIRASATRLTTTVIMTVVLVALHAAEWDSSGGKTSSRRATARPRRTGSLPRRRAIIGDGTRAYARTNHQGKVVRNPGRRGGRQQVNKGVRAVATQQL